MTEYNTVKEKLVLKEYGRNIQKLVKYLTDIEDKNDRTAKSETLIDLMKMINPNIKDTPEVAQKLWDDLHIISDFNIEIEGPFPQPDREVLDKKPERVGYNTNEIRFKHYGRNIELLVNKAITLEDPEEKEAAIIHIGKLMKTFFYSYNKDIIDDDVVMSQIKELSKDQLEVDMAKVKEHNLFEPQRKEKSNDGQSRDRDRSRNKGGKRNFKRRRN